MPFTVGFADGYIARESKTEAVAEEWSEGEVVIARIWRAIGG
jgi:hypothetical protein